MKLAKLLGVQKSLHKMLKYVSDDPEEKGKILKQLREINAKMLQQDSPQRRNAPATNDGTPTSAITIDSDSSDNVDGITAAEALNAELHEEGVDLE